VPIVGTSAETKEPDLTVALTTALVDATTFCAEGMSTALVVGILKKLLKVTTETKLKVAKNCNFMFLNPPNAMEFDRHLSETKENYALPDLRADDFWLNIGLIKYKNFLSKLFIISQK
jgi:ABC-type nitrate/sulfonate/bicarbonate transport system substrate-binding protein